MLKNIKIILPEIKKNIFYKLFKYNYLIINFLKTNMILMQLVKYFLLKESQKRLFVNPLLYF